MKQRLSHGGGAIPFWPLCWVLVPFSRLNQCPAHCGDVRQCSYLSCLCSAILLPVKYQVTVFLNITTQSRHVFLNIMGQSRHVPNHGITLVEEVMEKRMVTRNGNWDYNPSTYQHGTDYITNITTTFSINTSLN